MHVSLLCAIAGRLIVDRTRINQLLETIFLSLLTSNTVTSDLCGNLLLHDLEAAGKGNW